MMGDHKVKPSRKKWCFVPKCTNTSINNPEKIFVSVPNNLNRKKRWFSAARRDLEEVSIKTHFYCCEDHFKLEEDMENYLEFKLIGKVYIRMKPEVVPHIFTCQRDEKASDSSVSSDENEDEIPPTAKMEIQEDEEDQGQQFANNDTQTEAVDEDTNLAVPSSSRQKRIPTFNKAKRKYVRPKQTMKPAPVSTNTPIVGMVKILKSMYDQQIEKRSNVDEFDVYGELVARKLRNLSSRYAQITVQAMLNKIIYDAELGKYDAPLGLSRYDEYTNNCPNTATFSDIADNEKATTYSDPSLVPMKCELDDDFP